MRCSTLAAPAEGPFADAALIGIEPLSAAPGDGAAVLVFALRDPAQTSHAVSLAHALADVECGVAIADPNLEDTPLIYVNEAFTQLTGYSRAELLGRNCRFMQGHLTDQAAVQTIRHALARGLDCTTVIKNVRRSGEVFQNRLKLRPIRAADGHISHIVGIQTDVSREQAALASLDMQKRRHESLVNSVASYIWHMDADGVIVDIDRRWLSLAGLPTGDTRPALADIRTALGTYTAQRFRERWAQALEAVTPFEVTYPLPANATSPRWFQDRIAPVLDDEGQLLEWFGVSQEVTALRQAEQNLFRVIQNAPTGMLMVNSDGTIEYANEQAAHLFDYSVEALKGMSVDALVPLSVRDHHHRLRDRFMASPSLRRMGMNREVKGVRRDGTEFSAEIGLNSFSDDHEWRVIASITDKTELNDAHRALERAAYTDRVTGLLSRDGFAWKLDELREARVLHPASLIVSIDISGLREINNAQGFAVGDEVLREAGRRLTATVGHANRIARPAGGEFLVIVAVDRAHTPARWRQRLAALFDTPFEVSGFRVFIGVAFGYARVGTTETVDSETLMNNAELALRRSQQRLSVTWTQYTRALEQHTRAMVTTTRELRSALECNELRLYYQPKVDMNDGRLVSAEALLRWQHPERGLLPPAAFIPLAEQSQLIAPMGEWVLRQACQDMRDWQDAGLTIAPISVNISLVQFQLASVPDIVSRALTDFGIAPDQLTLEITESVFEEHCEALKVDLNAINRMGVKLSLDDFGIGYSSLGHLNDYPFDEIKIDKSFIWQLSGRAYGQAIVKAVHAIAEAIGAQVVAEGVESAEHVEALQRLGCWIGQGFYYSRPMPASQWQIQLAGPQGTIQRPTHSS